MAKKKNIKELEELESMNALAVENHYEDEDADVEESFGDVPTTRDLGRVEIKKAKPEITEEDERPNMMDGYIHVDKEQMPHQGQLYPDSWEFAYRCPTAKEVAAFSTVIDTDQPAIINVTEDLIRKCVMIFDTERNQQIPTGNLNDCDRTFFLLLLRDYYLPNRPIKIKTICQTCKEQFEALLNSYALDYTELKQNLIDAFDGRKFVLNMPSGNTITFHIPTLDTSSRIFRHLVKTYRNAQNNGKEQKETDNIVYDKTFLLFAPYLFNSGAETIKDLATKYKLIKKNESLFKDYLELATRLKLDNLESFESVCEHCGSMEETQISFPGGIKNLFVSTSDSNSYF